MHPQEHRGESFDLVCPHCQDERIFRVVQPGHLGTCTHCGLPLLLSVVPTGDGPTVVVTRPHEPPITRRQTAGLPEGIANDALEAARCYSFMAYRGAGLLARRTVEQAIVMLGVPPTKKTLQHKLHWLLEAGHLPKRWASPAGTILEVGNAAAHGAGAISKGEAHAGVTAALLVVTVLVGEGRPDAGPWPSRG
ncbi:MAG TPA: DUF4145 domain-containing protein [Acidimicrobiales bacterium]|nr:DUF4145 domain-containing protein [Acidimicrobiales bacterium]